MAIWDGSYLRGEYEFTIWMDPKRYRVMIWSKKPGYTYYTKLIKRMHDKDRTRLVERAWKWMDKNPSPVA